jgi:hypothetical protein
MDGVFTSEASTIAYCVGVVVCWALGFIGGLLE